MSSWRIYSTRRGKAAFWTALCLLTVCAGAVSLLAGSVELSPRAVLDALTGADTASAAARIVRYTRLPRTCAAMLAGAALAVSGAVIQTVLNNPLASPGIIGVNSGAGLAVALLCAMAPAAQQYAPLAAFAGALAGVGLIMILARATGAARITVVLAGVAISNLFSAGIDAVVTLAPEALNGVTDFRIGGFTGVTMAKIAPAAGMILVSLLLVCALAKQMAVRPVRFALLALAAALAGAAVSFSGLLSFVGLIVPHILRRLVGEESLPLLIGSALGGALFVTVCDLIARVLFAPFELPVGIVLAFAGAPFFLWLLFHQRGGRT